MAPKSPSAASKRTKRTSSNGRPRETVAELAPRVLALLPGKQGAIARELGRKASDGTVRRALQGLEEAGAAERVAGVWERRQELPKLATPPGLDPESERLHADSLKALQEQGTWRDHDIELLNDYVRRSQDARIFREARDEHGDFQTGGNGRVYAHPAIDKERDARRDVQALRDALVLTPDARRKHGHDGDGDGNDELDF